MSNQGPHERDARPRELLDVEDEDARQQRIQSLLEDTNASPSTAQPPPGLTLPPSKPHPVPVSDLISRAEAFLPRLAASNADLAHQAAKDPASIDIEHLGDARDGAPHIEMNLGLGVFSQRPPTAEKRTSTSTSSREPSPTLRSPATGSTAPTTALDASTSSESDEDSDENDESDDSDESDDGSVISALPPDEARALEALLSPRPILSPRFQQQQQQQSFPFPGPGPGPGEGEGEGAHPDAPPSADPGPGGKIEGGAGKPAQGKKPSIVVLTSGMDMDMDTGPQTARGWEEE